MGPLAATVVDGTTGDVKAANVTSLQAASNALISGIAGVSGSPALVVYSRAHKTWQPITSAVAQTHMFTQRRRGY